GAGEGRVTTAVFSSFVSSNGFCGQNVFLTCNAIGEFACGRSSTCGECASGCSWCRFTNRCVPMYINLGYPAPCQACKPFGDCALVAPIQAKECPPTPSNNAQGLDSLCAPLSSCQSCTTQGFRACAWCSSTQRC